MLRSSVSTCRPVVESRAPVGSSPNSTSGRVTMARASATRCCCPPESSLGRCPARSRSPTRSSTSRTSARAGRRPASRSGRATFCSALSEGSRLNAWKTKPIRVRRSKVSFRSLRPVSSVSPRNTWPPVGRSRPAVHWSRVDLPEPDGPMTAVNVPLGTSRLTPSSAVTAPVFLP